VEYLDPEQSNVWDGLEVASVFQAQCVIFILFKKSSYHSHSLDFSWLFLHAREDEFRDEKCRVVLSDSVFTRTPSLVDLMRVVRLIMHRLHAQQQSESEGSVTGLLLVLAGIVKRSKAVLSPGEFTSLKAMVFEHQGVLKEMFMAGGSVQGALFQVRC
jgi:nucleolar pre-ribosomal-associated protein 1